MDADEIPKDEFPKLRALMAERSDILEDDPSQNYYPMITDSPSYRPRDWWTTRNPEHLHAELTDVDNVLRESGIHYPLGARGVEDLAREGQLDHAWLEEVAVLAREHGWEGDYDDLAGFLRAKLEDVADRAQ